MKEKNDSFENFLLFPNVQYIKANEADISSSLKKKTFCHVLKLLFAVLKHILVQKIKK